MVEASAGGGEEAQEEMYDLTIVTGTHVFHAWEKGIFAKDQDALCEEIEKGLEGLWSAWSTKSYVEMKGEVTRLLGQMRSRSVRCILGGSKASGIQWTFPLTLRSDHTCDEETSRMLRKGTWLRGTKVLVPWFLLRPDLVTLGRMADDHQISLHVVVSLGADSKTAAFNREGCPRFKTILRNRDVYQQRLFLVAVSDISYQISKMTESATVSKVFCSHSSSPRESSTPLQSLSSNALGISLTARDLACATSSSGSSQASFIRDEKTFPSHMQSLSSLSLFNGHRVVKAVEDSAQQERKTTLVFVAGLEGVGHHMFARLGARHTVRGLYDALTNYLCDAAWNDDSARLYGTAREQLVAAMGRLKSAPNLPDGSRVFFLNTVFVEKAVNMYSYPWGGPRCFLKRFARVICNIDTIEIAKMANEAGVDLRIVVLKRSIGAAVVSASLHRPYGTVVSETRMLIQSWALLREGIKALDPKFTLEITYEALLAQPEASAKLLAEHLNVPVGSPLYMRFKRELTSSAATHPIGDVEKWKKEVSQEDLEYMTDILYLPTGNKP